MTVIGLRPDSRASDRHKVRCWVRISSLHRLLWARAVEISRSGATLESLIPIEQGLSVMVRCSSVMMLTGCATVRHCTRRGWRYRIGLSYETPVSARY